MKSEDVNLPVTVTAVNGGVSSAENLMNRTVVHCIITVRRMKLLICNIIKKESKIIGIAKCHGPLDDTSEVDPRERIHPIRRHKYDNVQDGDGKEGKS